MGADFCLNIEETAIVTHFDNILNIENIESRKEIL